MSRSELAPVPAISSNGLTIEIVMTPTNLYSSRVVRDGEVIGYFNASEQENRPAPVECEVARVAPSHIIRAAQNCDVQVAQGSRGPSLVIRAKDGFGA